MKDLIKALKKAEADDKVDGRLTKEIQKLLAYVEAYARQGKGGNRQPKN